MSRKRCGVQTYLVDALVVQRVAVGDVLPADGVVHVGLDAAGGDGVDGDLLVAKVWVVCQPNGSAAVVRHATYR